MEAHCIGGQRRGSRADIAGERRPRRRCLGHAAFQSGGSPRAGRRWRRRSGFQFWRNRQHQREWRIQWYDSQSGCLLRSHAGYGRHQRDQRYAGAGTGIQSSALCSPDLTVSKSHVGNFTRGSNASYTITVSNVSLLGATSGVVTVNDTLPIGLTPTSATGTGWTCSVSGQTVSCVRTDALAPSSSYPSITLNRQRVAVGSGHGNEHRCGRRRE